jgi:hypothetical protein
MQKNADHVMSGESRPFSVVFLQLKNVGLSTADDKCLDFAISDWADAVQLPSRIELLPPR